MALSQTPVQPSNEIENNDSRELGKHISLVNIEETDTEYTKLIQDNFNGNRQTIVDSLNPSELFDLVYKYRLDEKFTSSSCCYSQGEKADMLLMQVKESGDFKYFLDYLQKKAKKGHHMGHPYIVSLLKGEDFGEEKEIKESREILEKIIDNMSLVQEQLEVKSLLPYLTQCRLVTPNETEELESATKTRLDKVQRLLTILRTKGPTAYYLFLHKCLGKDGFQIHQDIYDKLTSTLPPTKKIRRSIPDNTDPTIVREPPLCLLPNGITEKCYIEKMLRVRQNYSDAKLFLTNEMDSLDNPLEARIAFCLERCYFYITNIEETKRIVFEARKMISNEIDKNTVLESRCELVLGRCYTVCGKKDQAKQCLDSAFTALSAFESGEDAILANYFVACSLSTDRSDEITIFLRRVIDIAAKQNYGMDIAQYCKIRLAQAYIGVSADNPDSSKRDVSQDDLKRASQLFKLKHEDMQPAAKCLYLIACSDVHRLDGKFAEAQKYAKQAKEIATSDYQLSLITKRQSLLQN
ncbi:uncharacterized protein LOC135331079 [Halichondria panicea]|uniref:uncharacterized protein LOC135331079 n=1 Tax=Halichondria panicea TaxID=6063 RepID=UPI00312BB526